MTSDEMEMNAWVIDRANQYIESGMKQAARETRFIRVMDALEVQGMVTSLEIEGRIRYRLTEKGKDFYSYQYIKLIRNDTQSMNE